MLTPQIGVNDVFIITKRNNPGDNHYDDNGALKNANVLSGVIGIRTYYAVSKQFGVSLIPEYRFNIASTKTIKHMANLDSRIKYWIKGFNCKISFTFCY